MCIPLKLINHGRTGEVFLFGKNKILKLFYHTSSTKKVELEYKIGLIINKIRLGPKLLKKINYHGRPGLIYQKIIGLTMMDGFVKKPWKLINYSKLLAETHFKINQQKNKKLPNLKKRLIDNIKSVKLIDNVSKRKIISYIKTLPDKENICHGDFHPDNILLSIEGPKIIDWGYATHGDPAADFVRTLILLKYGEISTDKGIIEKVLINTARKITLQIYKKKYQQLSGTSNEEIKKWELPIIAARLRGSSPKSEKQTLLKLVQRRLKTKV